MALAEQDKKTLQIGLFLAAAILAAAMYCHHMFFKETREATLAEIEEINGDIRAQRALRDDLLALADRKEEIEALAAKVLEASRRLPDERNAQEFYSALVHMLHTTGVNYDSVRPQPDRPRQLYTEIPYTVDANSAFHEFGKFLNLIEENASRFMRVSHLDIENDRSRPTVHPVNLEITTFMLHDTPSGFER
jgi:Tfp pilus assembly protein PilO